MGSHFVTMIQVSGFSRSRRSALVNLLRSGRKDPTEVSVGNNEAVTAPVSGKPVRALVL